MFEFNDFVSDLPIVEQKIVKRLRALVLDSAPHIIEKEAYKVPFYYVHARICYIWPASKPWGGVGAGVDLGFCKGTTLVDEKGVLIRGNHKEISKINFRDYSDISEPVVKELLYQAILIDEVNFESRKQKK